MLEYLAQQEAQNQQSFLDLIGAPDSAIAQYNQASQFPADVLYGAYGEVPGTALSQTGAAFGSAANDLSGIFGQQLSYNANLQAQEMAHARRMASMSSSGGGGGSDGGLTPYQQASLEMRAMEFAADQDRYAKQDELDWLKFEAELEKDELARQEREDQAAADSLLYMAVLNPELLNDKKFMRQLTRALGMGSTSAAGALTGAITGGREDAADAQADAAGRRQERREDMWSMLSFSGINDGLSKNQVTQKIMADIRAQYPNFVGVKEAKVRQRVQTFVNDNWANYRAGRSGSGGGGGGVPQIRTHMSSAFTDFVQSLDTPTVNQNFLRRYRNVAGYRNAMANRAVTAITGSIRDSMTRQQWNKNKAKITKMVRNYVRRNRGQFKVSKRPSSGSSGSSGGGHDLGR